MNDQTTNTVNQEPPPPMATVPPSNVTTGPAQTPVNGQPKKPNTKKLLLYGAIVLVIIIIIISLLSSFQLSTDTVKQDEQTPVTITSEPTDKPVIPPTIVPTVEVTIQRNPELDKNIPPGAEPNASKLTVNEQSYPEAKQQSFPGTNPAIKGTLLTNSNLQGVEVRIALLNEPEGDEATIVQTNTTPFKFSTLPAGYYSIDARKEGYDQAQFIIRIDPEKVTRLNLNLTPFESL